MTGQIAGVPLCIQGKANFSPADTLNGNPGISDIMRKVANLEKSTAKAASENQPPHKTLSPPLPKWARR
jgi:hypothetical protein